MAKVIAKVSVPFDPKVDWREGVKKEEAVVEAAAANLKAKNPGKYVGEEISFGVADGAARYLVAKEKPLELVWLEVGDAWHASPILIRGLRLADVKVRVDADKRLKSLFAA